MIDIKNITKKFPSQFQPILNDTSLSLEKGDFCVVLGSNGSGKSTLLKLIAGEIFPDSGTIFFEKKDITNASFRQRAEFMSMVTQDIQKGTIPEMTMLENLVLARGRGKKGSFRNAYQEKQELTSFVEELGLGLENYLETPLSHLSGGQRQIIALIMHFLNPPSLLLLDEHCSALDPRTSEIVMKLTDQLVKKHNITTLMVTHHLKTALSYGNRLIMLHQGKIALNLDLTQKKALQLQNLVDLFHTYEDQSLGLGKDA